jgi:hypothetical protein
MITYVPNVVVRSIGTSKTHKHTETYVYGLRINKPHIRWSKELIV